jgi:DNA-binding NarL/FixJ family response regulator
LDKKQASVTFTTLKHNLIIYEDNNKLRKALHLLLEDEADFTITGSFSNCDTVVNDIEKLGASIIVMDIDMPGIGGIEGVKLAKTAYPEIKIVMHTVFDDDNRIFESICAGADGYMLKNTNPVQFVQSLKNVLDGDVAMSPFVAQKVFQHFRKQSLPEKDIFNLTPREKEILQLLVNGNSYKMIAGKSFISIDTVKRHLQNIYHKLQVNCGTEAVVKALRHKIVTTEQ